MTRNARNARNEGIVVSEDELALLLRDDPHARLYGFGAWLYLRRSHPDLPGCTQAGPLILADSVEGRDWSVCLYPLV